MDEQEELRSSYRKYLRFIDGKLYLCARFTDEISNSTIEHIKRKILSAAKTILNGFNLRIDDLFKKSDINKKQHIFVAIGLVHICISFFRGMPGLSWRSHRRSFVSFLSGHQLIPDFHPSASYQLSPLISASKTTALQLLSVSANTTQGPVNEPNRIVSNPVLHKSHASTQTFLNHLPSRPWDRTCIEYQKHLVRQTQEPFTEGVLIF